MNDGTFGVTGECEPFDDEPAHRVETHRYDPVKVLQWRNAVLDFRSCPRCRKAWMRRRRNVAWRGRAGLRCRGAENLSNDAEIRRWRPRATA